MEYGKAVTLAMMMKEKFNRNYDVIEIRDNDHNDYIVRQTAEFNQNLGCLVMTTED